MNVVELLQQMIQIESISGNEDTLCTLLQDYLSQNFETIERHSNSLLVFLPGKVGKNCIVFDAHIDTVTPGDLSEWSESPYEANIIDGKLYGLGASDDKGCAAAMIKTLEELKTNPIDNDVYLVLAELEETTGEGSMKAVNYLVDSGKLKKYEKVAAMVGEPTELKFSEIANRGVVFIEIIFSGDSGHGSRPYEVKINAIKDAMQLITKQDDFNKYFADNYSNEILGAPTIFFTNVEAISGSVNKLASKCIVSADLRLTPELSKTYEEVIKELFPKNIDLKFFSYTPPGYTAADSEIVQTLKKVYPEVDVRIAKGANDMCWFTEKSIQGIVIGPGKKEVIHKPNEYMDIENLEQAVDVYYNLAKSF